MSILTLSGWTQPADALLPVLGHDAAMFDYSDYTSLEASFAALAAYRDMAHVVAWSMGGQLALQAIAAGILRPKKLTLIAAPYQFVSGDGFDGGMDPITYRQFRESYAKDPARTKQRFHALIAKGHHDAKRVVADLAHHPEVENTSRWLPWLDRLGAASLRDIDLTAAPPTTIIHGANDRIVPIAQGEALHARLPQARFERWEDTGHAPHLSDKERLKALL